VTKFAFPFFRSSETSPFKVSGEDGGEVSGFSAPHPEALVFVTSLPRHALSLRERGFLSFYRYSFRFLGMVVV